jgi:glycyl-tRNA synthetase beta subunit
MNKIKELEELLKTDVLIQVNEDIKDLEEQLEKKKNNKTIKDELKYMKEVKKYFDEVLVDIEKNLLKENDAIDILEGLEDMRADNQEV